MTVRGDEHENVFDYGFSKEKSKVLYNMHKMKIPHSFSTTIFNRHRIQYEFWAYSETDFCNVFFSLPCTVDRVEEINQHLGSVNLLAIDIGISDFGKNFIPSKLDFANPEKEELRESALKVLRKAVDLSNQNIRQNADGFLATQPHDNQSLLWPGGKRIQDDKFALSY